MISSLWHASEELLTVLPLMNNLLAVRLRQEIDEDITLVQFRVLTQLQERPVTLSELAEQRRVTRQATSLQVQGLVERGWVKRNPDPNDRRQAVLEVTEEGLKQLQEARRALTEYVTHWLDMLTPEELDALKVVLPAFKRIIATASELKNAPVED